MWTFYALACMHGLLKTSPVAHFIHACISFSFCGAASLVHPTKISVYRVYTLHAIKRQVESSCRKNLTHSICVLQKYFRAADLSNDQAVTMEEFLTAMDQLPGVDHKYVPLGV